MEEYDELYNTDICRENTYVAEKRFVIQKIMRFILFIKNKYSYYSDVSGIAVIMTRALYL